RYQRTQANSLQRASPLRCEPTLRHLWTVTLSRPPREICATTRIGHQGQRRVYSPTLRHTSPTTPQRNYGKRVVARTKDRSADRCGYAMAREPEAPPLLSSSRRERTESLIATGIVDKIEHAVIVREISTAPDQTE